MSVSLTASSVPALPEDQGELTIDDRRVAVDGTDTQYLEAGAGPPLLLLHGHEQSATSWRWVIPALARTHRVLAVSLPGNGGTAPAVGDHGSDFIQVRHEEETALMAALQADRPAVIDVRADPNVVALPPHATWEQTTNLFAALAKGDPDRNAVLRQLARQLAR